MSRIHTWRWASAACISVAAVAASAAPATADPTEGLVVEVVCDNGQTYTMIARAGATWNAQLVTDSTSVFHLTAYTSTFEVTAPDGTVEIFGPVSVIKGGTDREHKDLLNCTYALDIDLGDGFTAHVYGPAVGWLTPGSA